MNRVYNLTRLHSPMKTTLSPRGSRRQVPQTTLKEAAMKTVRRKDSKITIPDLSKSIQRNPSLICLENILRLPKINKEYNIDIEDDRYRIRYFENKKRVELTYRQKDQEEGKERQQEQRQQEQRQQDKILMAGVSTNSWVA
jgi:hypothetical protein